jgi:hypothetical protein
MDQAHLHLLFRFYSHPFKILIYMTLPGGYLSTGVLGIGKKYHKEPFRPAGKDFLILDKPLLNCYLSNCCILLSIRSIVLKKSVIGANKYITYRAVICIVHPGI